MCEGEDAFSAMYSKYLHFAVDSAWQSYSFDSKFDSVSLEVVTVFGDTIGECSISFSKGRSLMDEGIPFSFAVLAQCLSFLESVSVVSVLWRLSPSCEGMPTGGPMSPGV